jgi:hypothetical protein
LRLSPEQAFSHPFITKAVYELKGLRVQSESTQKSGNGGSNTNGTNSAAGTSNVGGGGGGISIINRNNQQSDTMLP